MSNSLYIDSRGLGSIRVSLQSIAKQIPGATASALNRTLDFTSTRAVKEVTTEYTLQSKTVKATIKKVRARGNSLYAYMSSTGKTLSLGSFQHTPRNYNKKAKQVKVKVKRNGGYKEINTSPKAFVQKIYGDQSDIYVRKDKRRFPVRKLSSLSVPQMIGNDKVMNNIQQAAGKKLQERINHEIDWRLSKAASKSGGK